MGLPDVPPHHRRELEQANELVRRTASLLRAARTPAPNTSWSTQRTGARSIHRFISINCRSRLSNVSGDTT
eukprot:4310791-Pleurochrysis_carterae.AAC.1